MHNYRALPLLLFSSAALAQGGLPHTAPSALPPAPAVHLQQPEAGPQSTVLGAGELGVLGGARIAVLRVQDSRCPEGTVCVWAGEVQAQVLLIEQGRWTPLTLRWRPGQLEASQTLPPASPAPLRIAAVSGKGQTLRLTLVRQPLN